MGVLGADHWLLLIVAPGRMDGNRYIFGEQHSWRDRRCGWPYGGFYCHIPGRTATATDDYIGASGNGDPWLLVFEPNEEKVKA